MCARIIPLLLAFTLLSACNGDIGAASDAISQEEDTSPQSQVPPPTFSTIEILRNGGIKCPDEASEGDTQENTPQEDLLCA